MKRILFSILEFWEWLITPIADRWNEYQLDHVIPHKKVFASNSGQVTVTTKGRKGREIKREYEKEGGSPETSN